MLRRWKTTENAYNTLSGTQKGAWEAVSQQKLCCVSFSAITDRASNATLTEPAFLTRGVEDDAAFKKLSLFSTEKYSPPTSNYLNVSEWAAESQKYRQWNGFLGYLSLRHNDILHFLLCSYPWS